MSKILIIPDSHAKPEVENDRYDWLARLIIDVRPDYVVDLGDFGDVPSLSAYDRGKLSGQNRFIQEDIEVAVDARKRLTQPIIDFQNGQRQKKDKLYKPRLIALGGNHEQRVDRYIQDHPELKGVLSQDVSGAAQMGWEWHPFLEKVTINGVTFCHYYHNNMGKPIGGVSPGRTLIQKLYTSAVCGHSHVWNHFSDVNAEGKRLNGLVAGCYFGHEEAYAKQSNATWDRCITVLKNVKDGDYDIEKISYDAVRFHYSGIFA